MIITKIDYNKLEKIAVNQSSRTTKSKDTSDVLSSYMALISNLIYANEHLTESEMAMIISSLNRWVTKKDIIVKNTYDIGSIIQMEWGNNFSPELSYKHPAVIIEEWSNFVFVVPATSSTSKIKEAYHPIENPTGKWYYRKVGIAEGFAHDCVLILNNAKIVSKTRIISCSGKISGDLNDKNNVFREIKQTMIKNFFPKEWIEYQKITQAYEKEKENNKNLQIEYNKLLEENKILKDANKEITN